MASSHELLKCVQEIQPISIEVANGTTIPARYRDVYEIYVGGRITIMFNHIY